MNRIEIKSREQLRIMARSGQVLHQALEAVRDAIKPGVTTKSLDDIAASGIREAGATSNFLNYQGYPATICTSVNEQIVHGIPGGNELIDGDVISVDGGAIVAGWHSDSAFTAIAGKHDPADAELIAACERALWAGIAALANARHVGEIGEAIEASVAAEKVSYGLIEDYTGHGIGSAMHMDPEVLNYAARARGARIKPGMCLAIEPMLVRGNPASKVLADGWTVITRDGSRAAHCEHSVAVMDGGIWVLTLPDGGAEQLAPFGITPIEP